MQTGQFICSITGQFYLLTTALNKEGYYYKECAINARSPLNEADDFEKEFLLKLNNDPKLEKTSGVRMIEGKPFFYVLRRGEIMEASCLRCHSDPAKAPGGLVASYGSERSFQRKVGDTVSAISIRIPLEVAYANVNRFVLQVSGVMVVILMTLLAGQLWFLSRFIFSPLALMHNKALQIAASREHLGEEIVVPSGIELSDLAKSFNRMSAALRENMDLIEDRVKERTAELAEANQSLMTEITERKQVEAELKDALTKVKLLSGMLPICSSCKKIRDDKGYWEEVADYITEHSEVLFSHGLCPDCEKKAFAELEKLKREDGP
jgi:HAMP domain-containing protein